MNFRDEVQRCSQVFRQSEKSKIVDDHGKKNIALRRQRAPVNHKQKLSKNHVKTEKGIMSGGGGNTPATCMTHVARSGTDLPQLGRKSLLQRLIGPGWR